MYIYSIRRLMKYYFDVGYNLTIDMENNIIYGTVYDHYDHDNLVLSFITYKNKETNTEEIFITGIHCHRFTSFGTEVITSFSEGDMEKRLLEEISGIFDPIYENNSVYLYTDTMNTLKEKLVNDTLDTACLFMNTSLPSSIIIDILKKNLPLWSLYKHDSENIKNKLSKQYSELFSK